MPGLVLLQGVPFVMRLGLTIAVRWLLAGDRLCWVDGVNAFDPYAIARLAKRAGRNPKDLLERVYVSRAFTCHQLHALVVGRLPRAVRELPADGVVAVGLGATFHDHEVPAPEAAALFGEVVQGLERLTVRGVPVLVVDPYLPQDYREPRFVRALRRAAGVVLAVDPAEDGLALSVVRPFPTPSRPPVPHPASPSRRTALRTAGKVATFPLYAGPQRSLRPQTEIEVLTFSLHPSKHGAGSHDTMRVSSRT
ncbi:MAG: hypothetical protein HY725_15065 [Candidatus Rokubacteria bacterium]|nr:hypothetical protein [Candidatus Rokubacteria bacterium]